MAFPTGTRRQKRRRRARFAFASLVFIAIFGWGIALQLISLPRYRFMHGAHRTYGPGPNVRGFRSTIWTVKRSSLDVAKEAREELLPRGFTSQKIDDNVVFRHPGGALEGAMIVVVADGHSEPPIVTSDDFFMRANGDPEWATIQISKADFIARLFR